MATILLLEDDANQCALYSMELEDEGYAVLRATNGREALDLAETEQPDLAIVDLLLPDMDGVETLCRLLATNPELPVVINTACPLYKDNFATWLADAFVVKSSDTQPLLGEVRKLLAERAARGPSPVSGRMSYRRSYSDMASEQAENAALATLAG